ncbi:MAG: DUF2283 domain-containing protein [Candidatus Woesearchaeota archaeon]
MKKRHLNAPKEGEFLYDYSHDILTFRIKNRNYKKSVEFQNFVIDIDEEDFVTGMRVFDASQVFGVDNYVLKNIVHGEFKASVENKVITITFKFIAKHRNRIIPLLTEKENITQQLTAPLGHNKLEETSVMCAVKA